MVLFFKTLKKPSFLFSVIKPSKYAEIIHVVELKLEATTLQDAKEEVEEFKKNNDIE